MPLHPDTHVIDHGGPADAPVVVLLHGFGGSALNWHLVAPALTSHLRVLAVDLYAHGRSAAPKPLSAAVVVDQVAAVVDSLRAPTQSPVSPVLLVGGSFGSTMAFLLARSRPDLVDGILVVNGALPEHPGRGLDLAMTLKRWLISAPGISALVFRKMSSLTPRGYVDLQLTGAGVDPATVDPEFLRLSEELEDVRAGDRDAHDSQQLLLRDLLRIFARGREFAAMTREISVPVRWLHSDDDPLIAFETARSFVADHPAWEFRSRPGLGHVPMVTDPGWVAEEILSWAAQHGWARA